MEASVDDDHRSIVATLFHPRRHTVNCGLRVREREVNQFNHKTDALRTPKQDCKRLEIKRVGARYGSLQELHSRYHQVAGRSAVGGQWRAGE